MPDGRRGGAREAVGRAGELNDELLGMCTRYDLARWWGYWKVVDGWATAREGEPEAAVRQFREGVAVLSAADAEAAFEEALAIAREQEAKSFELRAAISMARRWTTDGRRRQAHDLLAGTVNWVTEGHDTRDLETAAALLAEVR